MKHLAPQFELPAVEIAFNLAGETYQEPVKNSPAVTDGTMDMFLDRGEIKRGQMILEQEMKLEL